MQRFAPVNDEVTLLTESGRGFPRRNTRSTKHGLFGSRQVIIFDRHDCKDFHSPGRPVLTKDGGRMERHRDPGFLLTDLAQLYTKRFEARARGLSLTLSECKALAVLANFEGVSQKRLAEISEIRPAHLVRILDRMEAGGWAERRSHPRDRRAHSLAMTESAKAVLQSISVVIDETHADALKGFTGDELETLMELLRRVHANLSATPPLAAQPTYPNLDSAVAGARSVR
jgi:MarR family transcriptional regulator, transcriptional regulator for hemolysin